MHVYVDPLAHYGMKLYGKPIKSCHMYADIGFLIELHETADKIGLKRKWFQNVSVPHYDITRSKRELAVENGAIELDRNEAGTFVKGFKKLKNKEPPSPPLPDKSGPFGPLTSQPGVDIKNVFAPDNPNESIGFNAKQWRAGLAAATAAFASGLGSAGGMFGRPLAQSDMISMTEQQRFEEARRKTALSHAPVSEETLAKLSKKTFSFPPEELMPKAAQRGKIPAQQTLGEKAESLYGMMKARENK